MMEYVITLGVSLIINLILFIPAFILKTDKLTDASYSLSFFAVSLFLYVNSDKTTLDFILFLMIFIWSIRLGYYLLKRIIKTKTDHRFDNIRNNFFKFLGFWIIQAISVWIILIPSINFWINNKSDVSISIISLGIIIFMLGLIIESVADLQKTIFKNNLSNANTWIKSGLWKYSRHPNYFGEILVWIGIYVLSISSFDGKLSDYIAIIGPLYIFVLLRYFSGIPPLEKKYDQKFLNDTEYKEYKKRTNLLIIGPNKKLDKID